MGLAIHKIYRVIFGWKVFYNFNKLMYRCGLSGMGVLNYENEKVSGELSFLKRRLDRQVGAVVVDVGANAGAYTKAVLSINEDANVYAFEPHPNSYARLSKNLSGKMVNLQNSAVGDAEGTLQLYDYESGGGSEHATLYRDVIENIHKAKPESHEVSVVTLDNFASENGIRSIALLKIDTEGNEFSVLTGAKTLIATGCIDIIHFEFNEMNVSSRVFFRDFWRILPNYNFYRLLRSGMIELREYNPVYCEIFAFQNIVAIRKDSDLR